MTDQLLLGASTLGAMCFPGDKPKIERFTKAYLANSILTAAGGENREEAAQIRAWLGDRDELWSILPLAKELPRLLLEAQKGMVAGAIAGHVLSVTIRFASEQFLDRYASVNTSARVVGELVGRKRAYVMRCWKLYQPVSHLWAAFAGVDRANASDFVPEDVAALLTGPIDWLFDEVAFEAFLGIAEAFRRGGQRHHAIGAVEGSNLLPKGADLSLPFDVEDMEVADVQFVRPTDRMIAAAGAD